MKGLRAAFEQLSFAKGDGIPSILLVLPVLASKLPVAIPAHNSLLVMLCHSREVQRALVAISSMLACALQCSIAAHPPSP